jgi:hypothetical protein
MRRRPPKPVINPELLKQAEERSNDLIDEVALSLRDADPVDADLHIRLLALQKAAVRAAGRAPDLQVAALAAAREAALRAAGEEGCGILDQVKRGDWIVQRLALAFHTPSPSPKPH